jgi:hypothetical protein
MFEIEAVLKVRTQENRFHSYHCPSNANLAEIQQVLAHMQKIVQDKIKELEDKEELPKVEDEKEQAESIDQE